MTVLAILTLVMICLSLLTCVIALVIDSSEVGAVGVGFVAASLCLSTALAVTTLVLGGG